MVDVNRDRSRERDRNRKDRGSRFSETSRDRSVDRGNKDKGGSKVSNNNCRVYVSNVPYEYRWQELKDLFRKEVGDVAFVELFVDEHDKPRGCGIVEFADPESVKRCLEMMHRFEIRGRKLVIKEDFGNQRDKYGNLVGVGKRARERDNSNDRRGRENRRSGAASTFDALRAVSSVVQNEPQLGELKWGNTYGLSPQFLESLWISPPLISRVFVANLDYKVDKKKLKEVFRLAGKVIRVDLSEDKDGKSRGFAIVEYDHPVEAVQAISMFHNQGLYDRLMTVRMDREGERNSLKLPDGLKGIGMGLGSNGEPLKDVARNLPSTATIGTVGATNGTAAIVSGATGAGILGAVPNSNLSSLGGVSGALSNLNNAVGGINNAAVLQQAANLAGVGGISAAAGNLLASSLGSGDLSSLAAQLVGSNSLVQNPSLSALSAASGGGFGRGGDTGTGTGSSSANSAYNTSSRQQTFDDTKSRFTFGNVDRDSRQSANLFNSTTSALLLRNSALMDTKPTGGYSKKIIINNLPSTASYKLVNEKCSEFGNVQRLDDKGNGSILVTYSNEWEAERAIKNMDRARIDGRTIDVRFYY